MCSKDVIVAWPFTLEKVGYGGRGLDFLPHGVAAHIEIDAGDVEEMPQNVKAG